jgi:ATP-binding cassette subfamily C (CFTR/MRP) protein 10
MSVTLSPIYAHFSETLTGLSTIRALRESRRFQSTNETKLDINQRANYCGKVYNSFHLTSSFVCLSVIFLTVLIFVCLSVTFLTVRLSVTKDAYSKHGI